jgi:hypothetical protein
MDEQHLKDFYENIKNPTDLSKGLENPHDSILELAKIIFSNTNNSNNIYSVVMEVIDDGLSADGSTAGSTDESTEESKRIVEATNTDVVDMLIEFILHGFNILTENNSTIFSLENNRDDIIYEIKKHLKKIKISFTIEQTVLNDKYQFREQNDYYCEIVQRAPPEFDLGFWHVNDYRIIVNNTFKKTYKISDFKIVFLNYQNTLFCITIDMD